MKTNGSPSNRSFGLLVFGVLAIVAAFLAFDAPILASLLLVLGLGVLTVASLDPDALSLPNRVWMRIGYAMGVVVSPIVLGVIFFGLLTPVALMTRLFGRDELRLKRGSRGSYWHVRSSAPSSFKNQF